MIHQSTSPHVRRKRGMRALAIAALAALTLTACTASEPQKLDTPQLAEGKISAELVGSMEAAVETAIAASGASGAIVGVWVPWSGSWVAGVGTTSMGGSQPMKADMTFRAGAITRSMTCDALYAMAADGTVELDAPVNKLVSGVSNLGDVTLDQLCDSTSGLGAISGAVTSRTLDSPAREWDPREMASFGLGTDPLAAPGERYIDSNTGYILLGLALERASGLSAEEYLDKYVFAPLDLTHTSLPGPAPAAPGESSPKGYITPKVEGEYACAEPRDVTKLSSSIGWADSGVVSTITDLGSYGRALAEQTLAQGAKTDRYESPALMSDTLPSWFTTTGGVQFAGTLMGHDGSTLGYSTAVWSDPTTGLTVAVVLNNSTVGTGMIRALSWQLAALASTAPATGGKTVPEFGVPWTADEWAQSVRDQAICPIPAPEG